MGSFIARGYVFRHRTISGPDPVGYRDALRADLPVARAIARWDSGRSGRKPKQTDGKTQFRQFQSAFSAGATRVRLAVARYGAGGLYINDPMCGFDCSAQLWVDLFSGISEIEALEKHAHLPAKVAGARHCWRPRSGTSMGGLGIKQVCKLYQKAGCDVNVKLYGKAPWAHQRRQSPAVRCSPIWAVARIGISAAIMPCLAQSLPKRASGANSRACRQPVFPHPANHRIIPGRPAGPHSWAGLAGQ